jgi:hypothetical protein
MSNGYIYRDGVLSAFPAETTPSTDEKNLTADYQGAPIDWRAGFPLAFVSSVAVTSLRRQAEPAFWRARRRGKL